MFSFNNLYSHRAKDVIVRANLVVRHKGGGTFFSDNTFLDPLGV